MAAKERVSFLRRDVGREEARLADARRLLDSVEETAALLRGRDTLLWGACQRRGDKGVAGAMLTAGSIAVSELPSVPMVKSIAVGHSGEECC